MKNDSFIQAIWPKTIIVVLLLLALFVVLQLGYKHIAVEPSKPLATEETASRRHIGIPASTRSARSDSLPQSLHLYEELASDRLISDDFQAYRMLLNDFETKGALAAVTLRVIDENGNPVPDAHVLMSYSPPGGEKKRNTFSGTTDALGCFSSKGISCWDVFWHVQKAGYHSCWSNLVLRPFASVQGMKDGRWFREPFPATVVIRQKKEPHKMTVHDVCLSLPPSGESIGFDLVAGVATPPHGNGKTCDVEFSALSYPDERQMEGDWTSVVKISFFGCGNGGIVTLQDESCELDTPRDAPKDGYSALLESKTCVSVGKYSTTGRIQPNEYIIFRIRGDGKDGKEEGRCIFGKMKGDWYVNGPKRRLRFRVWINDGLGNRNLEDTSGWR